MKKFILFSLALVMNFSAQAQSGGGRITNLICDNSSNKKIIVKLSESTSWFENTGVSVQVNLDLYVLSNQIDIDGIAEFGYDQLPESSSRRYILSTTSIEKNPYENPLAQLVSKGGVAWRSGTLDLKSGLLIVSEFGINEKVGPCNSWTPAEK